MTTTLDDGSARTGSSRAVRCAPSPAAILLLALILLSACGGSSTTTVPSDPDAPELDSLAPGNGPAGGGTPLTLTGAYFDADPGATSVAIGGAPATSIVVVSATELTCVSPAGAPGAVDVALTTPGGTVTLENGWTYNPLPTVGEVVPSSGWADEASEVAVYGTGFQSLEPGTNTLTFGETAATDVVVVGDGEITATCPASGAGVVDVRVENANGAGVLADGFACFAWPPEVSDTDTRLDSGGAPPLTMDADGTAKRGVYGTVPDGRSDNAAVAASGQRVYVAWREMRNGIADICFNRSLDGGTTWLAADVRINHGGVGTDSANEVVLACDGLEVFAAWIDWRTGGTNLYFNSSSDGGQTWNETDTLLSTMAGASKPHLVLVGGVLHLVWRQGNADVMYRRSSDLGDTWADPQRVDAYLGGSDRPRVCASGSRVYVVWVDVERVVLNRSTDGGANWHGEQRLDGATVGFRGYVEACCDDEVVHVVWQDFRDDIGDIYYRSSVDGGASWRDEQLIDGDGAGTSDAAVPKIGCLGQVVYVSWLDWRNGGSADVIFRRSVAAGAGWHPLIQRVNSGPAGASQCMNHQMVTDGPNVCIVWSDTRNDPTSYQDVFLDISRDGGGTWLENDLRLNPGSTGATADRPQVACDGSRVYVAWQDSRPGLSPELDIRANASQP